MPRTLAVPSAQVAWQGQQTGVFRLDNSFLDGSDVLAGEFGNFQYDTITPKAVRITRGRQGELGKVEQGRCVLTLPDPDGTYNPRNPTSPLASYLDLYKPLRVQDVHGGTTYGLFYGFISKIEHHPNRSEQETVIEAVDFFEWLAFATPTIAVGATTVGAAIGKVLDALEWTDASKRSLDTGSTIPSFSADGTKTALTLIEELLAVDLGFFFIDGEGVVTYRSRDSRWGVRAVDDTFGSTIVSDARPSIDKQAVINRQTVTRTGGVAQPAAASDGRIFRDGSAIVSGYLATDADALSLAQFIVALRKDGFPPIRGVVLWNRDDTAITKQLARDLGDRVTFSETLGGTDVEGTIEGLIHEISDAGAIHKVSYLLSERTINAFTLDQSALDGSDVLIY